MALILYPNHKHVKATMAISVIARVHCWLANLLYPDHKHANGYHGYICYYVGSLFVGIIYHTHVKATMAISDIVRVYCWLAYLS